MLRLKRVILLLLLFPGCESQEILPKTTGTEYYPVRVDAYWEYDVVETSITQVGGQTTSLYELRILIADSVLITGGVSYVFERSKRPDASAPWTALDTWSAQIGTFQVIEQQGNIPFVKLRFPLSEGKSWNGNELNSLGGSDPCGDGSIQCDNYVVSSLAKPFESQGISYTNSVTIIENNNSDPIVMKDVRIAVYAKSIGLVHREETILSYCTVGDCIGKQIIENGILYKQTLRTHGGL